MIIRVIVVLTTLMLSACNSGPSLHEPQDSYEQLRHGEAAIRQAQLLKDQEQLKRVLEERKRREADAAAQVNALSQTRMDGNALSGPGAVDVPEAVLAQPSVYYDYDAYVVKAEYEPVLEAHAALLRSRPDLQLNVEGNCDERGSREYNIALGQRRADAVKRSLVLLGVSAQQISTVSFGSEKPKFVGDTEEQLAQNRRSDLVYAAAPRPK